MKRLLLAAVTALAIVAALAPPSAGHDLSANGGCRDSDTVVGVAYGDKVDRNGDLTACRTPAGGLHDNHVHRSGGGGGWTDTGCREGDHLQGVALGHPGYEADKNGDLAVCLTPDGTYYDDRVDKTGGGGGGWTDTGCREGDHLQGVALGYPGYEADKNGDLAVCLTPDGTYYDNRVEKTGGGGGGWTDTGCREGDHLQGVALGHPGYEADKNGDLAVCLTPDGTYYDNRVEKTGGGGGGWTDTGCREGDHLQGVALGHPGYEADKNGDLAVCLTPDGTYYDNRVDKAS